MDALGSKIISPKELSNDPDRLEADNIGSQRSNLTRS